MTRKSDSYLRGLREALAAYDAHADALDNICDDKSLAEWERREVSLADAASHEFWLLTRKINSRGNAALVRPVYWTRDDQIHRVAASSWTPAENTDHE